MKRAARTLWRNPDGAVAPLVALSLVGLVAVGGIAFDYARMASLDTELQQAADQAALAAATQLDGTAGSITRAEAAATSLVRNRTLFANDGNANGTNVGGLTFTYYTGYDQSNDTLGAVTTTDTAAKVVRVTVGGRTAVFALTPIVGAFNSGSISASAIASVGRAICKTPPVMMCNPAEPSNNVNQDLDYTPVRGAGLRLITGDATVPGNFGWLEASIGQGANALAGELGYNTPMGDCQPISGVTTKTGMSTSVLNAFNSRFDVYANGNTTCPSQFGGTCSPAMNTRKDLVCKPNASNNGCNNDTWSEAGTPYRLPTDTTTSTQTVCHGNKCGPETVTTTATSERYLKAGDTYPNIMGYPHDLCHAWPRANQTCSPNKIQGDGNWDRDAYFKTNYGWTNSEWKAATGLTDTGANKASRWDVYQWELKNRSVTVGGVARGIDVPQIINNNSAAFSYPSTGRTGIAGSTSQADRRRMSIAVINCKAVGAKGKTTNVPVPTWLEVFLVEPAKSRGQGGSYTDQKDVYVEIIGKTTADTGNAGQVVRRDTPYLIR